MPLQLIKCIEPSIECFVKTISGVIPGTIVTVDKYETVDSSSNNIVLGKIIKIVDKECRKDYMPIIVREVRADYSYGEKFKAIIVGEVCTSLGKAAVCKGDRLGFVKPEAVKSVETNADIKYYLYIGKKAGSLVCYSKKHYVLPKSVLIKGFSKESMSPSNSVATIDQATSTASNSAVKLQMTTKTKKPYLYKTLKKVKCDAFLGDMEKVNIIAVVSEIAKGLVKIASGRYSIICKLVDDSVTGELIDFSQHFFTLDSTIIAQIERGDILRLHRVKLESFENDIDGRIFFSHDIAIFKNDSNLSSNLNPITASKSGTDVTDEECRRILSLRKWYIEEYWKCVNKSLLKDITHLCNIKNDGEYNILVKVVSPPEITCAKIIMSVTDGTLMDEGCPQPSLHTSRQYDTTSIGRGHLVTSVTVSERLNEYSKIKENDYVYLRSVEARESNGLKLSLKKFVFPLKLDARGEKVVEIERSLKEWEAAIVKRDSENAHKQMFNMKDTDENISDPPQLMDSSQYLNSAQTALNNKLSCKNKFEYECGNMSCSNPEVSNIGKTKENKGNGRKKQLYTPNCMDLSEVGTDDTSVILDEGKDENNKGSGGIVVTRPMLPLDKVVEMVCTQLNSPKKQLKTSPNSEVQKLDSGTKKIGRETNNSPSSSANIFPMPTIKLVRIDEETSSSTKRKYAGSQHKSNTSDNSTIINLVSKKTNNYNTAKRRNIQQSISKDEPGSPCSSDRLSASDVLDDDPVDEQGDVTVKVSDWLTKQDTNEEETEHESSVVNQLLLGVEPDDEDDMSCLIHLRKRRVKAFLLKVEPDPSSYPLDLVSGYCEDGCKELIIFSKLNWISVEGDTIPLCPNCFSTNQEKYVKLLLMMSLCVMDVNGTQQSVIVFKEHAEQFFDCSVKEFVSDPAVRRSRVHLLNDFILMNSLQGNNGKAPMLDLSIMEIDSCYFVVDTVIELP